jgi:hypothetical protein
MRNSRIQLGWTVTSLPGQPAQDMVASSHPRLHVGQPLNPSFNQRFLSLAAFFDRPPTRGQTIGIPLFSEKGNDLLPLGHCVVGIHQFA